MAELLGEMDKRLRERGIAASVYVVGGAALTLRHGRPQMTPDIDVAHLSAEVGAIAEEIAEERGMPRRWLNASASPWVPPRPADALVEPGSPGLHVHYAPPEHLLAMKLIAKRIKDEPDIERLIATLGMEEADAADYADLLERVYDGEGMLEQVLGPSPAGARAEAETIGEVAVEIARDIKRT